MSDTHPRNHTLCSFTPSCTSWSSSLDRLRRGGTWLLNRTVTSVLQRLRLRLQSHRCPRSTVSRPEPPSLSSLSSVSHSGPSSSLLVCTFGESCPNLLCQRSPKNVPLSVPPRGKPNIFLPYRDFNRSRTGRPDYVVRRLLTNRTGTPGLSIEFKINGRVCLVL